MPCIVDADGAVVMYVDVPHGGRAALAERIVTAVNVHDHGGDECVPLTTLRTCLDYAPDAEIPREKILNEISLLNATHEELTLERDEARRKRKP